MELNKVLVVYKKSLFDLYSHSKDSHVREYARASSDLKGNDLEHMLTTDSVIETLEDKRIPYDMLYRAQLDAVDTDDYNLVIPVGGDGTFLNTSHYMSSVPLLGVNDDAARSEGFYLCANRENFASRLEQAIDGTLPLATLNRLRLELNGKEIPELILNEVLIAHSNPAAMSRYEVKIGDEEVYHKSCGLVVGPAAGSTARMRSEGGVILPLESKEIQYLARALYGGRISERKLKTGILDENATINVRSHMREGMLYIDGEYINYPFTLGDELRISNAGQPIKVFGLTEEKRQLYV